MQRLLAAVFGMALLVALGMSIIHSGEPVPASHAAPMTSVSTVQSNADSATCPFSGKGPTEIVGAEDGGGCPACAGKAGPAAGKAALPGMPVPAANLKGPVAPKPVPATPTVAKP